MIIALIILGIVVTVMVYLIVIGGKLKKAEYLESENENINKAKDIHDKLDSDIEYANRVRDKFTR